MAHTAAPTMPEMFDLITAARVVAIDPDPTALRARAALVAIVAEADGAVGPAELIDLFEVACRYCFAAAPGGGLGPAADALAEAFRADVMDAICCEDPQMGLVSCMIVYTRCDHIAEGADHDPIVRGLIRSLAHLIMNPLPATV